MNCPPTRSLQSGLGILALRRAALRHVLNWFVALTLTRDLLGLLLLGIDDLLVEHR